MRFEIEVNIYLGHDKAFIEFIYYFGEAVWKDQKNYRSIWGKRL